MNLTMDYFTKLMGPLFDGMTVSLEIFFLTILFAIPFGLVVVLGRMSKVGVIRFITRLYISIMRGTPLILQLMFIYFAPYYIFGSTYDRFVAVIIGFSLNYAAYFAEIYRGGILSIPEGQYEAAEVLGYSKTQTLFRIVIPQVVKIILPAMGNEVIVLVKDTSLAQIIAVVELFRAAQTAASAQSSVIPFFVAGLFYFVMNYVVAFIFSLFEKKMNYYK